MNGVNTGGIDGVVYSHIRCCSMGPFHYVRLERRIRLFLSTGVPNPAGSSPRQIKNTVQTNGVNTGGIDGARTRDLLRDRQTL